MSTGDGRGNRANDKKFSRHTEAARRVYGFLAEHEDARVCRDIPEVACDEQPCSFILQLAARALTKLADTIMSPRLVMPWMLSSLGAPAMFIGSLPDVSD